MNDIIVCDIGGTNSRFACFSKKNDKKLQFKNKLSETTNNYNSFEELLRSIKKTNIQYDPANYNKFIVALPGPVIHEDILASPNVKWTIDRKKLRKFYPSVKIAFINDFIAQAFGCLTEASADASPIIGKTYRQKQNDIAIIGAGTGTGHGALKIIGSSGYLPIPSEAGHTPFPFITKTELKFRDFLIKTNKVTCPVCNDVVSGPGLSCLHQFFTGKSLLPSEVVKELSVDSETTQSFSKFYARSCRNYSLTVLGSGGELFISGGVAIKNPFLVDNDFFRSEFKQCSTKVDELLNNISVFLIRNERIGLWGSAYYGFEIVKQ